MDGFGFASGQASLSGGVAPSFRSSPLAHVFHIAAVASLSLALASLATADDLTTYQIVLESHKFTPSEIHVPTGKPFIIVVTNNNDAADEFEMLLPALERTLQAGQQGKMRVGPLGPGRFPFFGESDPDNEQGVFVSE
jgi:hypothetical protein